MAVRRQGLGGLSQSISVISSRKECSRPRHLFERKSVCLPMWAKSAHDMLCQGLRYRGKRTRALSPTYEPVRLGSERTSSDRERQPQGLVLPPFHRMA